MFINNQKGSHGMFSKSGKRTLEKFQILLKKDEIINGIDKKVRVTDFYTPDQVNNLDTQEDEFKVYSQDPHEKQKLVEATLKKHKNKIQESKSNKRSKSLLTNHILKKHENPPCNKYNPNWEFVNKKLAWGPKWSSQKPRDFSMLNLKNINPNTTFCDFKGKFNDDNHVFIDFQKQLKRSSFINKKAYYQDRKTQEGIESDEERNNINDDLNIRKKGNINYYLIFLLSM